MKKLNYIQSLGIYAVMFIAMFFVFGTTTIHASSGVFNWGGPFPMDVTYSGLTPGGCDNSSADPTYSINASNTTGDHYVVSIAAFHSDQAGCTAYDSSPASGWTISGTTDFPAHASGSFNLHYDASSYSCGRVQYDAGYTDTTTGDVTVFIGQVINYGIDCGGAPPPPPPSTGTLAVTSNMPSAAYYITGPNSFGWNGSHTFTNQPVGSYSLAADDVSGYTKTITPSTSGTLTAGGTLSFDIVYTSVPPPPPPPVVTHDVIYCNNLQTCTINSGDAPTISWTGYSGATSCNIYNVHSDGTLTSTGWSGVTGSANPTLFNSITYRILCNSDPDINGNNALVLVNTPPPSAPTVTISANPTSVSYNNPSTLTWSSTNATSCTASGDWSGSKSTGGSEVQNNLTSNKNYTITCTGAGGSASASASVSVGGAPILANLSILKTSDKSTASVGDTVTYTVVLTNAGPNNATGVTVTDVLNAGLNFVSATPSSGSYATSTGIWTVGNLNNASSATLILVTTVKTGYQGQTVPNTATATATQTDPTPGNNTSTVNVAINGIPSPAGKITFCIILTDANNIIATTSNGLPAGIFSMNLATTSSFGTSTIQSKTWVTSSFSPNKRIILNNVFDADCITYQNLNLGTYYYSPLSVVGSLWAIPQYNDQNTQPVNSVSDFFPYNANSNSDGQITLTSSNLDQTLVILQKDNQGLFCLAPQITSALSLTATAGVPLTYLLTASSTTPVIFSTGVLPSGLSFSTTTNTISGTPTLSGTFNIQLFAINTCIGGIDAKILALNVLPAGTPGANLSVSKTSDKSTANVGDTITYTINVSNSGPNNATGVIVTDILPDKLNFVSATTSLGSYSITTGVWTIGNLNNGSSTILTIIATIKSGNEGQTISNTSTVSATQTDSNPSNNTSTVNVAVNTPGCISNCGGGGGGGGGGGYNPNANLIISKTSNETTAKTGDEIIYTINLINAGPDNATGVVANDLLPNGLSFVSATSTTGIYNPTTGVWTIGNLNNGSYTNLTIHATVKDGYQGQTITNSINVYAVNQSDPVPGNNTSKVDVLVTGTTTLTVTTNTTAPGSCYYLYDYLRKDFNNNPVEVRKLQVFLRDLEGFTNIQITGIYDDQTIVALDAFQARYAADILTPWGHTAPTDYTYITTKKKVNEIYCRMAFPVTPLQQAEIDAHRNFLLGLQNAGITPPANQSTTTPSVLLNNEVGVKSTTDNMTLAGVSTTTTGIVSRFTANVLSAWNGIGDWFGSFDFCHWLNLILLLIIAAISYLWYKEHDENKKLDAINKEIDLK